MPDPMNSPQDVQALDPEQQGAPPGAESGQEGAQENPQENPNGAPSIEVCIKVTPDGKISVYDTAGMVQPQPFPDLQTALQAAGQLIQQLSKRYAVKAMQARQQARPGNADAQSIWDQMAASRPNRGNT